MELFNIKIMTLALTTASAITFYLFIYLFCIVLDWEVETGLQSVGEAPPEEHCHCYKRLIPDLCYNLKNEHVAQYTDLLKGQAQLDPVLGTAHQQFMGRLYEKVFSLLGRANMQLV